MPGSSDTSAELLLRNDHVELRISSDGLRVALLDRIRSQLWVLDVQTRLVAKQVDRSDYAAWSARSMSERARVTVLSAGHTDRAGASAIRCQHDGVELLWELIGNGIRVTALPDEASASVAALMLPGTFRPDPDAQFLSAVPNGQGVLHTGRGDPFFQPLSTKGHRGGFAMSMFGQIGTRGGLLTIAQTDPDAILHWEKTAAGPVNLMWLQLPSLGALRYPRQTLLVPTDPGLVPLCKAYRRHVMSAGRFKSWDEKIAERPALAGIFGAATVFIGYLEDRQLDYAASFRQLKAMGIDRALVYPLYCATTIDLAPALGVSMIDQRRLLPLLHELGYLPGSFIYIIDGPRSGDSTARLRLDASQQPSLQWKMGELEWYALSSQDRLDHARRMIDQEHQGFAAVHYDVVTTRRLSEDWNAAAPSPAADDKANRAAMLDHAASRGLIVSSEGFWDDMTPLYDMGNTKYPLALGGDAYCIVPMTMLVYHDSAMHTWWEVDNYNNPHHRSQGRRGWLGRLPLGGGWARQQAAMDALMGTPPDLFPFGMQYNFVPENHPQIYTYRFRLEDAAVRQAIALARPVMDLHARIGRLEMIDHRLHRPDGAIQETVFADGSRIIANFANVALEAAEAGLLPPASWKQLR
jgi:hypothetical protein